MSQRRVRRRTLVVLAVLSVPSLALGFASTPTARDRVIALLGAIEAPPAPVRLDEAAGGVSARTLLTELAVDENVSPHARWQAISELASYPSEITEIRLRQIIEREKSATSGQSTLYTRAAAIALAQVARERAVRVIAPLLVHEVVDVRADAARALALTGAEEALTYLRERRLKDPSVMVRTEIAEAIATISR